MTKDISKVTATWSPLLFILKNKGINIKDYDYVEGQTNTKKMMDGDHPFLMYNRRFYMNPFLWSRIMESKVYDAIDFMLNKEEFEPDLLIVRACLGCNNPENKYPSIITMRYLNNELNNDNISDLSSIVDEVITSVAESNRYVILKEVLDFANMAGIEPKYGNWGNAGNGDALYYSISCDDTRLAEKLLELGADPSRNDSMSFVVACKKAKYRIANIMIDKGINIHTKNDLAMRMIERNDQNNKVPDSEKEYRLIIIDKFIKEKVV